MKEKILKLLQSNNFGDIYIGLKLLDSQSRGKIPPILRKLGFQYKPYGVQMTWYLDCGKGITGIPSELSHHYILGKNYAYCVCEDSIIIDDKAALKWTMKEFPESGDLYKIAENWRDEI